MFKNATDTDSFYKNGGADGTAAETATQGSTTDHLTIGQWGGSYFYNGLMDEVRVESVARSSNWVWACWLNQTSNSLFNSYGTAGPVIAGVPVIANVGAVNVATSSAGLVGNLTTGDAPVTVVCYWGTNDGGQMASAWMTNTDLGVQPTGYLTNSVTGLISGQSYSFRYYASNSVGVYWTKTPVTFSAFGAPTVDNGGGAASVSPTGAQLRGTVLSGSPNPNVWIYWGTVDGVTNPVDWNLGGLDLGAKSGAFSTNVVGLLANQGYWYRCYVSNAYGEAWATSSTNFAAAGPNVTINDVGLPEGAAGETNTAVFTVSLSATSVVDVTVNYVTSNGTATVGSDYLATSGMLTIPAGALTNSIAVSVLGDNSFEPNETFFVKLSTATNGAITDGQGQGTITNDDFTYYVRGDGSGSDTNNGATWGSALATLQAALNLVPFETPVVVCVQASTGSQSYATCARSINGEYLQYHSINVSFKGGWQNVDTTPVQSGVSLVKDAGGTNAGISIIAPVAWDDIRKTVWVDNFSFTNVTQGISIATPAGSYNYSGISLTVSNVTISALTNGISLVYAVAYPSSSYGGTTCVTAVNADITAGLSGVGHGIYINGAWKGSSVTASGTNAATQELRVSTITSAGGCGVYFTGYNNEFQDARFANTVIYGCASNGILLDATQSGLDPGAAKGFRATLNHCTIADNGGDGLAANTTMSGNSVAITNSILSQNTGHGAALGTSGGSAFVCSADYNVFYGDDILTNGVAQAFGANTSTSDPLFKASGTKADPWYKLISTGSPAYGSAYLGGCRGAYQGAVAAAGMVIIIR